MPHRCQPGKLRECDQHAAADQLSPREGDETARGLERPSRRQDVVDHQHAMPPLQRVAMHLESIRAVLEIVGDALDRVRKLSRFSYRNEACPEMMCNGSAKDEAAALDADHM